MVIDEKALLAVMRDAFKKKSTGYKAAARLTENGEEELILSAPGWSAIVTRENAPRKVMGLVVEHVGDLPRPGEAYQVQDKNVQAEIFSVAVPAPAELVEGAAVKRTNLTYSGYQIWQRTDNLNVFMIPTKFEDMMDNYNRAVRLTENGMFYVEGVSSRLYFLPLKAMENDVPALRHLAKMRWV